MFTGVCGTGSTRELPLSLSLSLGYYSGRWCLVLLRYYELAIDTSLNMLKC